MIFYVGKCACRRRDYLSSRIPLSDCNPADLPILLPAFGTEYLISIFSTSLILTEINMSVEYYIKKIIIIGNYICRRRDYLSRDGLS